MRQNQDRNLKIKKVPHLDNKDSKKRKQRQQKGEMTEEKSSETKSSQISRKNPQSNQYNEQKKHTHLISRQSLFQNSGNTTQRNLAQTHTGLRIRMASEFSTAIPEARTRSAFNRQQKNYFQRRILILYPVKSTNLKMYLQTLKVLKKYISPMYPVSKKLLKNTLQQNKIQKLGYPKQDRAKGNYQGSSKTIAMPHT